MSKRRNLGAGVAAGVVGGLAAAWAMNVFSEGPGKKLSEGVQDEGVARQETREQRKRPESAEKEDATMKMADGIAMATTGEHLTREKKETYGPVVHYAFGAVMGGLYGGLAEYVPMVRSGFGTTFATALFAGVDLVGVPLAGLTPLPTEQPMSALVTPYATHLVYGVTTELVRRVARKLF